MGTSLFARAFGGALLLVLGCGGKVFVDGQSAGAGGSTTGTTGSSADGGGGGAGVTCDLLCGGPAGACGCAGACTDGRMRAVGCGSDPGGGAECTCSVDGQVVGMCSEASLICGLPDSCCATIFGL